MLTANSFKRVVVFLFLDFLIGKFSFSQANKYNDIVRENKVKFELKPSKVFELEIDSVLIERPVISHLKSSCSFVNYDLKNGFVDQFCYEIDKDKDGNLWIGTDREGLCYFNGNKFKIIDGLASPHVKKLQIDKKNRVWVGTYEGIEIVNNFVVSKLDHIPNKISERVREIEFVDDNSAIVSFQYSGIQLLKLNKNAINYEKIIGNEKNINSIQYNKRTNSILYAESNKLIELNIKSKSTKLVWESGSKINQIIIDKESVYLATDDGFFEYKFKNKKCLKLVNLENITSISKSELDSCFYIGTYYSGLYKLSNQGNLENVLSSKECPVIYNIFCDEFGQIWLGTGGLGLVKVFSNLFRKVSIKANESIGVSKIKDGLYAGTDRGFIVIRGDSLYDYGNALKSSNIIVWDIKSNGKDRIWVASSGLGAFYIKNDKLYLYKNVNSLFEDHFGSIALKGDSVLLGGYKGFCVLYKNKAYYYNSNIKGFDGQVSNIYINYKNDLFVTTTKNILINTRDQWYNLDKIKSFDMKNECIFEDQNNLFFLGSGVLWIDKKFNKRKLITKKDGLKSNFSNSICKTSDSLYWIGTNSGISVLKISKNGSYSIKSLDYFDGFTGFGTNQNGAAVYKGKIYWGTLNGLIVQELNSNWMNFDVPKIKLEKVTIDFSKLIDVKSVNRFVFDWHTKFILFELSSVNIRNYKNIVYSYYLDGYSDVWSDWSPNEEILFSNLPVNRNLALKIRVKNLGDNEFNEVSYLIFVNPPFWKTKWFIFLFIFLIIALLYIFYKSRIRVHQKRQVKLEVTIAERTNEIEIQKRILEVKQKEIIDSIQYASRIQRAILPTEKYLRNSLDRLNDEKKEL